MKKIQHFGKLALVALTLVIASCNNDDAPPAPIVAPIPANASFIRATVDGVAFSSNIFGTETASTNKSGTGTGTLIQILGADLGANNISITLMGITSTGTYTLDTSSDSVIAYTSPIANAAFGTGICAGSTGTLIVTAYDATKIEGTFTFIGKDGENCATPAKNVTAGSFKGVFAN